MNPCKREAAAGWAAVSVGIAYVDWRLDQRHDGSTFSEFTRWAWRVHTRPGRILFTAALALGAAGFHQHITNPRRGRG